MEDQGAHKMLMVMPNMIYPISQQHLVLNKDLGAENQRLHPMRLLVMPRMKYKTKVKKEK